MHETESFDSLEADDYQVYIGNREWMSQNGLPVNKDIDQLLMMHEELGQTAVLVAVNGS